MRSCERPKYFWSLEFFEMPARAAISKIELNMNFVKLLLHKLRIYIWLFRKKSTPLDFFGESALSLAGRWHGELNPILTYIPMLDLLRQNKVAGEFLELGGGYSTVLAANILDASLMKIRSVDL